MTDAIEVLQELERTVTCLACVALNAADNLDQDCDALDDGLSNGSCP